MKIEGLESEVDICLAFPFDIAHLRNVVGQLLRRYESLKDYGRSAYSAFDLAQGHLLHKEDKVASVPGPASVSIASLTFCSRYTFGVHPKRSTNPRKKVLRFEKPDFVNDLVNRQPGGHQQLFGQTEPVFPDDAAGVRSVTPPSLR